MQDKYQIPICIHIDASDLPTEVDEELNNAEMWTHDQDNIVHLSWNIESTFPKLENYLEKKYTKAVKIYNLVAIEGT